MMTSNAIYRCTELFLAKNYMAVKLVSFALVVLVAFAYYVVGLVPAIDPILGLPNHVHEGSALILGVTVASSITGVTRATLRVSE